MADLRAEVMDLWVVDIESTGLDVEWHVPVEVAAVHVRTGQIFEFVPYLHRDDLAHAEPDAFRINRYYERGVYKSAQLSMSDSQARYAELFELLRGHRFGGANPRFDALMLTHAFGRLQSNYNNANRTSYRPADESWHYRLADVCSYTAGALGLEPEDIPSLTAACELLNVRNDEEHSAIGDARAAAECFRRAHRHYNFRTEKESTNA